MGERLDHQDRRRRRNTRVVVGIVVALLGMSIALGGSLVVFSGAWAIGGTVVAGAMLILLGVRVALGTKLGGELAVWVGVVMGVAGPVVSIVVDQA
jgi:hypothetical protein